MDIITHSIESIYNEATKILILGSFPSVKSRESGFYYMHSQNRFYRVLSIILNKDIYNCSIEDKKRILLDNNIGIFDVIKSCVITGSSDASITDVTVNDIDNIILKTNIKKIFLNGGLAYKLFIKHFPSLSNMAIKLPSTSPANAKYSLEDLVEKWIEIKKYL